MLKIEKILFPTDLSESSLKAVPLAAHLAKLHGADLHMLHVYVLHTLAASDDGLAFPGEEEARRVLEESVPEFSWNRVLHHVARDVHAAPAILRFADENDIDMIVMGSHGRRGFRRLLLGSVAEEVVRMSARPVLVVRDEPELVEEGFDRVLVPVDFSNHAGLSVAYGLELASVWGAELDVLHVVEPPPYADMQFPQLVSDEDLRAYAEDRLTALTEAIEPGIAYRSRIVTGFAADTIVEEADRQERTLIVMPSHGHRGMERMLLGSVTERVLRRASSPILVLRAGGRSLLPDGSHEAAAVSMGT